MAALNRKGRRVGKMMLIQTRVPWAAGQAVIKFAGFDYLSVASYMRRLVMQDLKARRIASDGGQKTSKQKS